METQLLDQLQDLKNFWINDGHSFGITAAGGAGWQLAEWIIDGEPTIDMLGVDPRRYGSYVTKSYLMEKNEEAMQTYLQFIILMKRGKLEDH